MSNRPHHRRRLAATSATPSIDELAHDLGLTVPEAIAAVTELVAAGAIIEISPGRYRLALLTELEGDR